mmetsp:Transcript_15337/g.22964  ORF Transcript_15337/g.22964 Transcript_15337/m.22964 type:complete len:101 (+) Transcript_15337:95-397(+)
MSMSYPRAKSTREQLQDAFHRRVEFHPTTPPFSKAFPNQNQAKYCWVSFLAYQKCVDSKSEDQCKALLASATALCPKQWLDKWQEEVDSEIFPKFWTTEE